MENLEEVKEFYENGAEIGRLERGLGVIEAPAPRRSFPVM